MLTRITVHVESMEANIPQYTERTMAMDLEADNSQYLKTLVAVVSENIVPLLQRTIEQHLAKLGEGPVKQLFENTKSKDEEKNDGKDSNAQAVSEVPAVAPTEIIPPGGEPMP